MDIPLHSIPVAKVSRTEYFVRSDDPLTVDEVAAAARDGQVEAIAHHYADGPLECFVVARGVRTADEMRAFREGGS